MKIQLQAVVAGYRQLGLRQFPYFLCLNLEKALTIDTNP